MKGTQMSCAGGTSEGKPDKVPMFHDENMGFFRRLAWSPEGTLCLHKQCFPSRPVSFSLYM